MLYKLLIVLGIVALISVFAFIYHPFNNSLISSYNSASENWNYNEFQKIDKNQINYTFVVYGDNRNSSGKFDQLINKVNGENILFSIDLGDLVNTGNIDEYKSFISQINRSNSPVLTVIGNHELMNDTKGDKYISIFGNSYYSFILQNSYFIVLDDANLIGIDNQQMQWLQNELQKSQNYKYRFVLMHVPLFDPQNATNKKEYDETALIDVNQSKQLNDLFDQYNVTMIFASHVHAYYNGTWGKTPYIITGGAGAPLINSTPDHSFYHYILVTVTNDGVKYEVIKY
jgi:hypothetical protein